jgi:hypothetical protein
VLVSHRHRFILTKTRKTGGTSVESYFEPFCMADGEWTRRHYRQQHVSADGIIGYRGRASGRGAARWWNHMPAAVIRQQLGADTWNAYFKFCVIRNPFEKAISAYYHGKSLGHAGRGRGGDCWSDRDPELFAAWLERTPPPADRDVYCIDGAFALDGVIRHERLLSDTDGICRRLGLPWEPDRMPAFKAGVRPPQATAERLYTARSRQLVTRACQFELEYFGYEFPGAASTPAGRAQRSGGTVAASG